MFPFVALQAVRQGEILAIQFGTLMSLWGNLENILPKTGGDPIMPEFVPLYTIEGTHNAHASKFLLPLYEIAFKTSNLIKKRLKSFLLIFMRKLFIYQQVNKVSG